MGRSKQNNSQTKKVDGKYRQETREERKLRIQQQQEARDKCMKFLPIFGGLILVFVIVFSAYVRSVKPKTIPPPVKPKTVPPPETNNLPPDIPPELQNNPQLLKLFKDNPDTKIKFVDKTGNLPADAVIQDAKAVFKDTPKEETIEL